MRRRAARWPVVLLAGLLVFGLPVVAPAGAQARDGGSGAGTEAGAGAPGESAAAPASLIVASQTLYLLPQEDALQVIELITLRNDGDAAVGTFELTTFQHADAYRWLSGFDGALIDVTVRGLALQAPLLPQATHRFNFAYRVPLPELPHTLFRTFVFPVDELYVLLPAEATLEPLASDLTYLGEDELAGEPVAVYRIDGLSPQADWPLGLRDAAAPPPVEAADVPVIDQSRVGVGAWGVAAALLLFGVVVIARTLWGERQRRRQGAASLPAWFESPELLDAATRRQAADRLLAAASRLAAAHRAGDVPEAVYQAELQALLRAWRHVTDSEPAGRAADAPSGDATSEASPSGDVTAHG